MFINLKQPMFLGGMSVDIYTLLSWEYLSGKIIIVQHPVVEK